MLIIAVFNIIINTNRKEGRHEEINPEILFRYK